MLPHEVLGITPKERHCLIKAFVRTLVSSPDEMMNDGHGTRGNRLDQHGMMATGIINSITGTKTELMRELLDTEPRVFRTL
eukprot:5415042-Heterocapsa_arctica.AAC.1